MKVILTILLLIISSNCFAQINTFYVSPNQTDVNYAIDQDSHMVVRNTTENINKLFLFIGGSGSSTESYKRVSNFAGNLGFDVLNISYPNDVPAASLSNSSDNFAFDKYRQEICYGTALSSAVTVDSLNSIYLRTVKLLNYLTATYPSQNWSQYLLDANTLDWSKIAVGGHSQGAGHACYFAKFENADRALMFSGPNDYSDFFSQPANWISVSGVTPMNQHFSYLSLLDEIVDFSKQFSILDDLGLYPLYDTLHTDVSVSPFDNSHCLYTTQEPGLSILYHNSTMKFSALNNSVWEYMLTSNIISFVKETKKQKEVLIYPNPTQSEITVQFNDNGLNMDYYLQNVYGQTIKSGRVINADVLKIDLSSFESGIYFLNFENQIMKIIKE